MNSLINSLKKVFPDIKFLPSEHFSWSPETKEVLYIANESAPAAQWSLLHETGHALLDHTAYQTDVELLKLEVAAWAKAEELAKQFNIQIDHNHIQDCLDTYRDWLYRRSICPACGNKCLQQADIAHYRCFNCHTAWRVTSSLFCRTYRQAKNVKKTPVVFESTQLNG